MSASEDTEKMERVLEFSAREFTKRSGPQSEQRAKPIAEIGTLRSALREVAQ